MARSHSGDTPTRTRPTGLVHSRFRGRFGPALPRSGYMSSSSMYGAAERSCPLPFRLDIGRLSATIDRKRAFAEPAPLSQEIASAALLAFAPQHATSGQPAEEAPGSLRAVPAQELRADARLGDPVQAQMGKDSGLVAGRCLDGWLFRLQRQRVVRAPRVPLITAAPERTKGRARRTSAWRAPFGNDLNPTALASFRRTPRSCQTQ